MNGFAEKERDRIEAIKAVQKSMHNHSKVLRRYAKELLMNS